MFLSVEGAWTTWDGWGACSGTCNANTRTRSMLYNGNLPCTGTSSETGNCQSESIIGVQVAHFGLSATFINFQLRGHGQLGEHLGRVQKHVALEVDPRLENSVAIDHALVVTRTHRTAMVSLE